MKTSRFILIALLGILPGFAVDSAASRTIARAEVNFFEPSKFTDVKDTNMGDYERTGTEWNETAKLLNCEYILEWKSGEPLGEAKKRVKEFFAKHTPR